MRGEHSTAISSNLIAVCTMLVQVSQCCNIVSIVRTLTQMTSGQTVLWKLVWKSNLTVMKEER